jgi:NAD-dependent dihydropyrimidine dehydrogenase PreA subunit
MRHLQDVPTWIRDTALRMLPHATRPGLYPIGTPGRDAPLLCTGNFTLTVRRMKDVLAGHNVWLLVANSHGINVWCAAGGGHLTHHSVIAALRSSEIGEHVDHRTIVLPQLAATGVERKRIRETTGWEPKWGPARLEDLPAFLDRGLRVKKEERSMRFPLWERLEMAITWFLPMVVAAAVVLGLTVGGTVAWVAAVAIAASVCVFFVVLPWVRVTGPLRWLTHLAFAVVGFTLGAVILMAVGGITASALWGLGIGCAAAMGFLAIDLAGTTPLYPSTVNTIKNHFEIELAEERCSAAADCVLVCPRDVLQMNSRRKKVSIARPERCIRCGACIVQCPEDALRFRFDDGRVVEPHVVRSTRLNMLGRRAVHVSG